MRIDPKNASKLSGEARPVTGPSRRTESAAAEGTGKSDNVDFSRRAETFRRMRDQLEGATAPNRPERVAELKALIARGGYKVEGERIADAVLNDQTTADLLE